MSEKNTSLSPYRNLEFILGAALAGGMCLLVALSFVLFPGRGEAIDLANRLLPPFRDPSHILGTDPLGRDILPGDRRGRISLLVGALSVGRGGGLRRSHGPCLRYYRGIWETLVMRLADIQLALPFILMAITFAAILGGGLFNTILLLVISNGFSTPGWCGVPSCPSGSGSSSSRPGPSGSRTGAFCSGTSCRTCGDRWWCS
jgi:peptide/nickel transport system permease protein